ncbi:MAG: DUF1178 family protein [Alphaproteobacteria bacterium]
MIHFNLRCGNDHEFEAWFQSGAAFESQSRTNQVTCPICGDADVTKAPMAPAVAGTNERAGAEKAAQVYSALKELRKQVEANCDYVGERFAEEARSIHYGEKEERGIYGKASNDDAKALTDEGIEFARIPWVKREH